MGQLEKLSLGTKALRYVRDPAVAAWRKLLGVAAVAYLISPVDFIPDVIPLLGWLDDAGVMTAAALFFAREIKRHAEATRKPPTPPIR
jgi:uncharacterized membrane protein YkvA (DUF1232 family)